MRVKITVHVPTENSDAIREALGSTGAGTIGEYSYCSFTSKGTGRFIPSTNASPHIGSSGIMEEVLEDKIEVVCDRETAKEAIKVMKKAHPYEEAAFEITPILEESEL